MGKGRRLTVRMTLRKLESLQVGILMTAKQIFVSSNNTAMLLFHVCVTKLANSQFCTVICTWCLEQNALRASHTVCLPQANALHACNEVSFRFDMHDLSKQAAA